MYALLSEHFTTKPNLESHFEGRLFRLIFICLYVTQTSYQWLGQLVLKSEIPGSIHSQVKNAKYQLSLIRRAQSRLILLSTAIYLPPVL